jgi:uncharacterized protein YkwD
VPAQPNAKKIILSMLACAALTVGSAAASTAPALAGTPPHTAAASRLASRSACTKNAADASRRDRPTTRRCRSHPVKPPHTRTRTLRTHRTKKQANPPVSPSPAPEAGSAPAIQASPTAHDATIANVLATPCQNTELTPEPGNIALVRAAVLCLINVKRAENGENPLVPSAQLEQAAEGHCQELIADDYFAHVSPSGETPVDRIRETGYIPAPSDGYVIGENLAWGTYQLSTPQAIVSAWIASPGHLANILEAQYRETGIGVTPAVPASLAPGAPGATYAQEFGVIIQ